MPIASWDDAMIPLATAQQALFSHEDDVTVMGGFGGLERGWPEVGPRLAWAASHFYGGAYSQRIVGATVGRDVAFLVSKDTAGG